MPVIDGTNPLSPDTRDLKHFFYYACGEDPDVFLDNEKSNSLNQRDGGSKSKKKGKKKNKGHAPSTDEVVDKDDDGSNKEKSVKEIIPKLNALEEKTRVPCTIRFSGFHPPPQFRRLMGDLAYLEVSLPDVKIVNITATPMGFFVNKSSSGDGNKKFDPSPATKHCFSHELLDCLLKYSDAFSESWVQTLDASKLRGELMAKINEDGPFSSFFRVAIRGDLPGYSKPSVASASEGIDSLIQNPSWLVPIPLAELEAEDSWKRNCEHDFNYTTTEEEFSNSFGVDVRAGALRDWNEELQVAREMPVASLQERIERARMMNKVLNDFGEAALLGVKGISDGMVTPMNPNEATRSQVYLHNNIFFSRAVDAGIETFKLSTGDKAARKSASRDLHCLGVLHRMEGTGLHTLATVLVDYLGSRFVCQSILPGILNGEKTHTLLYGAVEAGTPLVWDKEMHELFENSLGKSLMVATRKMPKQPLTPERAAEVEAARKASPLYIQPPLVEEEEKKDEDLSPTIDLCAPLEAKGIRGSDQRKYVLDMSRLTPRDANWVPKDEGGTGKWESLVNANGASNKDSKIPKSLEDNEWTLAILRNELVTGYAQKLMTTYLREKHGSETDKDEKEDEQNSTKKEEAGYQTKENEVNAKEGDIDTKKDAEGDKKDENSKGQEEKKTLTEEDIAYLKSLRLNVNVFLPDIRSLEGIDDEGFELTKKDEEMVRNVSTFLWDEVIPTVSRDIRQGTLHSTPNDGRSLTEFIHQRGINCRYLGRLATLAKLEEDKDRQQIEEYKKVQSVTLDRRKMPLFWLELLECEMVARSAKHVLDRYLSSNGGMTASMPAQTVASFLSALVSEAEETAAQTENRTAKRNDNEPDEEDFSSLTFYRAGGDGDAVPSPVRSRYDVWNDIEEDIGRRFRYNLTIFNRPGKSSRVPYTALLRRVCQRTGVRIAAKYYDIGRKCLCSDGGSGSQIIASYPIAALDIMDIVPLMKHAAAHGEGFVPCGVAGLPALHISLPDARAALEAAHMHHSKRMLSRALDLAQEAAGLYQRVSETPAHPGVVRSIDLMGSILYDAQEPALAAANASRALGFQVQISGFDSSDVINFHFVIFQFFLAANEPVKALKHMKAAIYLMELMGGPNHYELSNAFHKVGTVYHGGNDMKTALIFYQEATSRDSSDRLLEGMIMKSSALVLASSGDYKSAVESEKRAFQLFSVILGENHQLTKQSDLSLRRFMAAAVEKGSQMVDDLKKKQEEDAALKIASEIEAEEAAEEERRKKKNQKKKKGKK